MLSSTELPSHFTSASNPAKPSNPSTIKAQTTPPQTAFRLMTFNALSPSWRPHPHTPPDRIPRSVRPHI
jgi:hypothetical protein